MSEPAGSNDAAFVKMPRRLMEIPSTVLGPLAKLILADLHNRMRGKAEAWPSYRRMAKDCGTTTSAVRRAIKQLTAGGFIEVIKNGLEGRRVNLYRLGPAARCSRNAHKAPATISPPEVAVSKGVAEAAEVLNTSATPLPGRAEPTCAKRPRSHERNEHSDVRETSTELDSLNEIQRKDKRHSGVQGEDEEVRAAAYTALFVGLSPDEQEAVKCEARESVGPKMRATLHKSFEGDLFRPGCARPYVIRAMDRRGHRPVHQQ